MLPSTIERVPAHTSAKVNAWLEQRTRENVDRVYRAGRAAIDRRLEELEEEWDIERMLETNAATFALAGTILGATVDRRWLALPLAVSAFLLQHAIQGWCPPIPFLRRLGFRTSYEIDYERYALKTLRGDFQEPSEGDVDRDALAAAMR